MDTRALYIWLQQAIGVGQPQSEAVLRTDASVQELYAWKQYPEEWQLTTAQRRRLRDKDLSEANAVLKELAAMDAWVMTPEDERYELLFGGMYAPPLALYGKGEWFDISEAPGVAIVGTRNGDEDGILTTRCLAAGLAAGGAFVVSGGAVGMDCEALKAAMDEGGHCISFQACGIDVDYPKATAPIRKALLENGGILLTEFPLGTPALRHHFRIRNRLISAAARGTLVTQAPLKSGALLTAMWAREQGREVFAAPGSARNPLHAGNNELLKDGAKPVTCAADILIEYVERYPFTIRIDEAVAAEARAATKFHTEQTAQPVYEEAQPSVEEQAERQVPKMKFAQPSDEPARFVPCPSNASEAMKQVYNALSDTPQAVGDLARALGMSVAAVLAALTMLELQGALRCEAGQRYALRRE